MITNDAELENALAELDKVWSSKEGTPEFEIRDRLVFEIVTYEEEYYPIQEPTPEEMDRFLAEHDK